MSHDTEFSFDSLPDDALLRWATCRPLLPIGRSEVDHRIQEGRFPAPVAVGPRARAFKVRDIRAWLKDPLGWRAPGVTEITPRTRRDQRAA